MCIRDRHIVATHRKSVACSFVVSTSISAVSYTHLDVYKRQVNGIGHFLAVLLFGCITDTAQCISHFLYEIDVYKRQGDRKAVRLFCQEVQGGKETLRDDPS